MNYQTINFDDLPKEVLLKIPFSLRTSGNIHYINDLPTEVQYIIKKYLDLQVPEIKYENALDIKPEISVYSDLETFTDIKHVIVHYLKNYLLIALGSYPFDCDFGSRLKHQLQTKDTSLRNSLVSNEIGLIAQVIGDDFDMNVSVTNISTNKIESTTHTEYHAKMTVSIDDSKFTLTV